MAEKVIIDIEARFNANLGKVKEATRIVQSFEKAVDSANKATDSFNKKSVKPKADIEDSKFLRKIRDMQSRADKLGKTRVSTVLGAVDKATQVLGTVSAKFKSFVNGTYNAILGLKDYDFVSGISSATATLNNLVGRAWNVTLGIVDKVTAPVKRIISGLNSALGLAGVGLSTYGLVIKPVQLQVEYENLQTQFGVLLGSTSAAEKRIEELTSFAGQTPFTRDEIYQASKVLETYTSGKLATPESVGGLRQIGDIAAGTGADYTSVANAMGQMYVNMSAGNGIGDSLMSLRLMGALSAEAQAKIESLAEAVKSGSMDIDTAWAQVSTQFSRFDGMMEQMSNKLGNLLLGVKSFVTNNFTKKIGAGISESLTPFLSKFRTWRSENSKGIAEFGASVQEVAADLSGDVLGAVENIAGLFSGIFSSDEFRNAETGMEKLGVIWDGISEAFADWWGGIKPEIAKMAGNIGNTLGEGITAFFQTIAGVAPDAIDGGASIGGSFAKGFLQGMDFKTIASSILTGLGEAFQSNPVATTVLSSIAISKLGILDMFNGVFAAGSNMYNMATGLAGSRLGGRVGTAVFNGLSGSAASGIGTGISAGMASGLGLGAVAGGLAAGATAYSAGKDFYNAYSSDNKYDKTYSAAKGGTKVAGIAAGAAIGTMILPGVGTAIGAGIGGLAGWMASDSVGKAVASDREDLEKMAETSEAAAQSLAELKKKKEELASSSLAEHFGDITLSAEDLEKSIKRIFGPDKINSINKTAKAMDKAVESYAAVEEAGSALEKGLWMAKMKNGAKLTSSEMDNLKSSVKSFGTSASTALDETQYAATMAVQTLMGESKATEGLLNSTNKYFDGQSKQLATLQSDLEKELNKALKDGVIGVDEEKSINEIMASIDRINKEIQARQREAEMNELEARYGGKGLTADSFKELMAGAHASGDEMAEALWDSFGIASVGKSAKQVNQLKEGLYSQMADLRLDEYDFGVGQLKEKYSAELGILGGDVADILQNNTREQIMGAFGGLSEETVAAVGTLAESLKPTKESLEEVAAGYEALGLEVPAAVQSAIDQIDFYEMFGEQDPAAAISQWLDDNEKEFTYDMKLKGSIINGNEAGQKALGEAKGLFTFAFLNSPALPVPQGLNVNGEISSTITPTVGAELFRFNPINRSVGINLNGYINSDTMPKGYTKKFRGGILGGNLPHYAQGDLVRGGAQLAVVAEEGTPEMIIPLGAHRRQRGRELWEKAGQYLGIPGFANGGIVGGEPAKINTSGGSGPVTVDVGGITIQVEGNGNIADNIEEQKEKITEVVAEVLNAAFKAQFENSPARG